MTFEEILPYTLPVVVPWIVWVTSKIMSSVSKEDLKAFKESSKQDLKEFKETLEKQEVEAVKRRDEMFREIKELNGKVNEVLVDIGVLISEAERNRAPHRKPRNLNDS